MALLKSGIFGAAQGVHTSCCSCATLPSAQVSHTSAIVFGLNIPSEQDTHAFLSAFGTWPDPQAVHIVAFDSVETLPVPHILHSVVVDGSVSASRYVPGRQSAHDVSPSPLVNLPSAHVEQANGMRRLRSWPSHEWCWNKRVQRLHSRQVLGVN